MARADDHTGGESYNGRERTGLAWSNIVTGR